VPKYSIEIKQSAQKELDALDVNPRPAGCKKLKSYKDQWRIRIGDYRVIYLIDESAKTVTVTRIAHRRKVYE
jgi:mRNA interferase RelE/StbE